MNRVVRMVDENILLQLLVSAVIWKGGHSTTPSPATCEDVYHTVSTMTGVYTLVTGDRTIEAFCQFNTEDSSIGYFFPSLQSVQHNDTFVLDIHSQFSEKDEIIIRVIYDDGSQFDARTEQLDMYSDRNLTTTLNYCDYETCLYYSDDPFLAVNFLHVAIVNQGVTNGWKSNGVDLSFTNCDSNPGSSIVFFPSTGGSPKFITNYPITANWRGLLTPTSPECVIPAEESSQFKFTLEFKMGGCGVYEVSTTWPTLQTNPIDANGAAVGFKFRIYNSCENNSVCGPHGDCVDTIHSYFCSCHDGFFGILCDYAVRYVGCFVDTANRTLSGSSMADNSQQVKLCAEHCIQGNHNYMGLQAARECFCGDTYDVYGRTSTDTACNSPCIGNADQYCGAHWRMSVYQVQQVENCNLADCQSCDVADPQHCVSCSNTQMAAVDGGCKEMIYIGCFVDQSERAMSGFYMARMAYPSVQGCLDICSSLGFRYAGLEIGRECFCDDTFDRYGPSSDPEDCSYRCGPLQSQECGGSLRLSVYSVVPRGRSTTFTKTEDGLSDTPTVSPLASVKTNIGAIDCSRIAFRFEEAKSFSYDSENHFCHIYDTADGIYKNSATTLF